MRYFYLSHHRETLSLVACDVFLFVVQTPLCCGFRGTKACVSLAGWLYGAHSRREAAVHWSRGSPWKKPLLEFSLPS